VVTRTNDEVFALAVGGMKEGEIGLSDKKPVRNEQREGLQNCEWVDYRCLVQFRPENR
jgi:hypothetical protein